MKMYFNQQNLEHKIVTGGNGFYHVVFKGDKEVHYLTPFEYKGLILAQQLKNVGLPTNVRMDLQDYIEGLLDKVR